MEAWILGSVEAESEWCSCARFPCPIEKTVESTRGHLGSLASEQGIRAPCQFVLAFVLKSRCWSAWFRTPMRGVPRRGGWAAPPKATTLKNLVGVFFAIRRKGDGGASGGVVTWRCSLGRAVLSSTSVFFLRKIAAFPGTKVGQIKNLKFGTLGGLVGCGPALTPVCGGAGGWSVILVGSVWGMPPGSVGWGRVARSGR